MLKKIVIVGEELYENAPYKAYLLRTLAHEFKAQSIDFIAKKDTKIEEKLEHYIDAYTHVVVVSSAANYPYLSKLLSSLTDGTLELVDNQLIPTTCEVFDKKSFVVKKENTYINLLEAQIGKSLPKLLLSNEIDEQSCYVLDMDEESCQILSSALATSYDVKISTTTLIDGLVKIKVQSQKYGNPENFIKALSLLFSQKVIPDENLARFIIKALARSNMKVSFAESCTGGKIAAFLTAQSGASEVFLGSVISYSNVVKQAWLEVAQDTLEQHGAVSEQSVKEMAIGALKLASSDLSVSVSGVAGPSGGSDEKPVGLVYVGSQSKGGLAKASRHMFKGDREYVQDQSVYAALKALIDLKRDVFMKN